MLFLLYLLAVFSNPFLANLIFLYLSNVVRESETIGIFYQLKLVTALELVIKSGYWQTQTRYRSRVGHYSKLFTNSNLLLLLSWSL